MKIFVTGASGFVGSAVTRDLVAAGHHVIGLVRSEAGATRVREAGGAPSPGDLEDLAGLARVAAESDGVIHTGFNHDFSRFKASCEHDREVIAQLASALAGSERPLVVTSGIGLVPSTNGQPVTEDMMPSPASPNPRIATEQAVRAAMDRGVRVSVVRLPPTTHGKGDHGFVPMLIDMARDKRVSAYVGAGDNLWAAAHRVDAAKLYRLAVERAAPAAYYHAAAERGVPFKRIAEIIGARLNVPVVSKTPDEAAAHFTWFAHFAALSAPASSARTREQLGWTPTEIELVPDLEQNYFA